MSLSHSAVKHSRGDSTFFRVGHGVGSDAGTGCCASISYIFGLALANELELLLEHMLWNFIY